MNFIEYCQKNKLNIKSLSQDSIESLAACYLENHDISQADIDDMAEIDQGHCSVEESIAKDIRQALLNGEITEVA